MYSAFSAYFRQGGNVDVVTRLRNAVIFFGIVTQVHKHYLCSVSFPHTVYVHVLTELKLSLKESLE